MLSIGKSGFGSKNLDFPISNAKSETDFVADHTKWKSNSGRISNKQNPRQNPFSDFAFDWKSEDPDF